MAAAKKDKSDHVEPSAANAGDSDAGSKGGGLINKILVGAFVSGVIIAETLVFFFLVPSGEEVAALAEHRLIEIAQEGEHKEKDSKMDVERVVEFDLGTFGVSFIPAGADYSYRVEFKLFGELLAKDSDRLQALFAERQGRFRNRMILEIRNASFAELQESQLGLIRRRLLATSTELLGEAILLNVGFHDYQVIED